MTRLLEASDKAPESLVGLVISLTYYGLLQSALGRGQTLGKRLLRIEVIGVDGAHLSIGRAVLRSLFLALIVYPGLYASLLATGAGLFSMTTTVCPSPSGSSGMATARSGAPSALKSPEVIPSF